MPDARERLAKLLVGNEVGGFDVGDCWAIRFISPQCYLNCHVLSSSKEMRVSEAIRQSEESLLERNDAELISQSAIVASVLHKIVVSVSIDDNATLKLEFEGGVDISVRSDTDIVDWQWSINISGRDPYSSASELACFEAGEISQMD